MRKPTICIGEKNDADQLRGNREADQRLCFRYTDSTIPLLSKSKVSSFWPVSDTVQASLCHTWTEPKLLVFSRTGSIIKVGCEGGRYVASVFQGVVTAVLDEALGVYELDHRVRYCTSPS